jgi:hypothetical protein
VEDEYCIRSKDYIYNRINATTASTSILVGSVPAQFRDRSRAPTSLEAGEHCCESNKHSCGSL